VTGTSVSLIVVAAGRSTRFGSDKLSAPIGDRSVLDHAVDAVRAAFPSAPAALVVRADRIDDARRRWGGQGLLVVAGGERRQDSVRNGFEALRPADDAVAVVHDGARPYVPVEDVRAVVEAATEYGAALLVAPVVDTVKRIGPNGLVATTIERGSLCRALTPQAFRAGLLRRAWMTAGDGVWTDEAALVERAGLPVRTVQGDARNVKITTPEDLRRFVDARAASPRVGQGIDVHSFAADRPLWLCGIELHGEVGLAGHSDADVALHAVTDAILGACGVGDIGQHFPPDEERWRGASSELFVRRALEIAAEQGFRVTNCDVTLLAERPRIAPHRERMRARLAELLGVPVEQASLKATTAEGMGFVGRREGIAAVAVVVLERVPRWDSMKR
jgi:2-C-methyl-D-erythritol 4-phosphate cytidylyltransferase/2-C-methyl-D-erythritol 2,4-cyclodiphosphate synthase